MNNTTVIMDGITFLRNDDIVLLIGCFGFCAVLAMLVIGQMKSRDEARDGTLQDSNLQLPVFLRWNRCESETDFSFE